MIDLFPKISAVYYGLLQSGYGFYSIERSAAHIEKLRAFCRPEPSSVFFAKAKQDSCDVYPYWPRAFIMEAATFFLNDGNTGFRDLESFRQKIMSAVNISEKERDDSLWDWLDDFPQALSSVLSDSSFAEYLECEKNWIAEQEAVCREELGLIDRCLEICTGLYRSPVRNIRICIDPIKCVYSSDYHLLGDCFVFTSGALRTDSVIHEYLHHVVHPRVELRKALVSECKTFNSQLDGSYYLSDNGAGAVNAFEETVVRALTEEIVKGKYPEDLSDYLDRFLTRKRS